MKTNRKLQQIVSRFVIALSMFAISGLAADPVSGQQGKGKTAAKKASPTARGKNSNTPTAHRADKSVRGGKTVRSAPSMPQVDPNDKYRRRGTVTQNGQFPFSQGGAPAASSTTMNSDLASKFEYGGDTATHKFGRTNERRRSLTGQDQETGEIITYPNLRSTNNSPAPDIHSVVDSEGWDEVPEHMMFKFKDSRATPADTIQSRFQPDNANDKSTEVGVAKASAVDPALPRAGVTHDTVFEDWANFKRTRTQRWQRR